MLLLKITITDFYNNTFKLMIDVIRIDDHIFVDKNGRTSKLIMNMNLMKSGYVPVIVKKDNRLKYYETLDKVHKTGDYTDFVKLVQEQKPKYLTGIQIFLTNSINIILYITKIWYDNIYKEVIL